MTESSSRDTETKPLVSFEEGRGLVLFTETDLAL
jgi:hypothetical protein